MNKIFLTGFMGSGKSTVGPLLAARLGWKYVDLDQTIEEIAGKAVSDIFREEGEARFRDLESQVLSEMAKSPNQVISLGGGALLRKENWSVVNSAGTAVYLKAEISTLETRLAGEQGERPLLRDGSLAELFEQRRAGYERSRIQISTDEKAPRDIADEIIGVLERGSR